MAGNWSPVGFFLCIAMVGLLGPCLQACAFLHPPGSTSRPGRPARLSGGALQMPDFPFPLKDAKLTRQDAHSWARKRPVKCPGLANAPHPRKTYQRINQLREQRKNKCFILVFRLKQKTP